MSNDYYTEDGERGDRSYDATTPAPGRPPLTESLTGLPAVTPNFMPPVAAAAFDPWNYRVDVQRGPDDLRGFHVEAADGRIGKVSAASDARDDGHLVVDTGPWIFGRKLVIPAGSVNHIDYAEHVVYVDRTKEQVKGSPELAAEEMADPAAREKVHGYYRDTYEA